MAVSDLTDETGLVGTGEVGLPGVISPVVMTMVVEDGMSGVGEDSHGVVSTGTVGDGGATEATVEQTVSVTVTVTAGAQDSGVDVSIVLTCERKIEPTYQSSNASEDHP